MNLDSFKKSPAGRCLRAPEGYWAFVPHPLPPDLPLDWSLVSLLSEADAALGALAGTGARLPNPHPLIQPHIRREAVLSSRIENTQAGIEDLFYFEAAPREPPRAPDVQEVANYVQALEYGLARIADLPFSGRLVREVHARLMKGVRGGHATPGEFRRTQNWIGPPGCTLMDATYVPPPVPEMNDALSAWERYLNEPQREPPLVQCALMHYQFEAIHPFIDGNGRVGRLLVTFFLCERGLLPQPLLYLSAYLERRRDEYYRRLLDVSQGGEWRGWIQFFLRGIVTQAREAVSSANAILDLHKQFREAIRGERVPHTAPRIVDHLFTNPILSISNLARLWELDYQTLRRGVKYLERLGILREITGRRRNRLFIAPRLRELLAGRPFESARSESPGHPNPEFDGHRKI